MSNDQHRILCTRPLDHSLVANALRQGLIIDIQEFIRITPLDNPALTANIGHISSQPLVFTSMHAVDILAQQFLHGRPPGNARICCISGNTRQHAEAAFPGCEILAAAPYGKELAEMIIQRGSIHEVNFFCGTQRRDELPSILRQANITVNEYVIYENSPAPAAVQQHYDGILFFSPSAVSSFFSMNRPGASTICFAIGRTTAAALKEHTSNEIIVSPGTDAHSILQAAASYFNNH
ncbi:uroporphyrinogen-III synthase [Chitinophaga vietnamensis]|uniref:uroporphyrinogen-III synthase n=1 Tax=Chitinophaga vietnamensis TaxID=2593957 RepID=UPI0011784F7D|nr:uroporphyrinogen-III synthase [Chitinophaga vietnamensis]